MTYHRMAMHEGVDTHTLRKALWNYIHCLYGIRSVLHIKFYYLCKSFMLQKQKQLSQTDKLS